MTTTPPTLTALGSYWTVQGGVNLGVVGNQKHCTGYHLGRDRIYSECACKPDGTCEPGRYDLDYSVRHDRDKAGLSRAASAIDLGRLNGTLTELYRFSEWLVARCQAKAEGTADIREVIYWNPSQGRVERWDGVGRVIRWGVGQGDLSHKTHTHISYFRDSEFRDKRPAFRPYFEAPQPEEPTLVITRTAFVGGLRVIRFLAGAKAAGYVPRNGVLVETVPERTWTADSAAKAAYDVTIDGKRYFQMTEGYYAPSGSTYVPASSLIVADPDPRPITEADLDLAYDGGLGDAQTAIAQLPRRAV